MDIIEASIPSINHERKPIFGEIIYNHDSGIHVDGILEEHTFQANTPNEHRFVIWLMIKGLLYQMIKQTTSLKI
jgi:isopropylmalate/homocitrate/citramalate synthase